MAPPKRKRNERGSVDSGDNRPSPHRPGNTALGQHDQEVDMRGSGGGRRPSRGGRGGGRTPRNESRNSSDASHRTPTPSQVAPGTMSPPPAKLAGTVQTQAQPPAATSSPLLPEETPVSIAKSDPLPYDYSHVTDNRVRSWSTSGRQEVIAAATQAFDDLDVLDLSSVFQELLRAALDGRIDATDAGECIRDILPDSADDQMRRLDGSTLFLDSLSIVVDTDSFDPILQKVLSASEIAPSLMRKVLDAPLLQDLGLARNTFIKSGIRQVTNLLYRQANHNLLREETEGYSKLVTELFTTSGSEPPTSEVVEETFEKVKGLIGTFDLDVGRVLDVTLDVFAAVLIKQFRFFIKFLRISSWWPRESEVHGTADLEFGCMGLPKWALPGSAGWTTITDDGEAGSEQRDERDRAFWARAREVGLAAFFELGGRQSAQSEAKKSLLLCRAETDAHNLVDIQWIDITGTLPPRGNRVAAQLLGFKLRFYASEARDQDDSLPQNLIYLTALLIKIGFISLRDLYAHLWPLDEDMSAVREAKMKELAEKERASRPGGGAKNALMMAGALSDDTIPITRNRETANSKLEPAFTTPVGMEEKEKEREALPEPNDQKIQLLTNLLTIGAIPESLFMLGRFPWLPEACPDMYDLIHRVLHHSINKVYEESQVAGVPTKDVPGKKLADVDQASAPKGQIRRVEVAPRKPLRWPFPDKHDTNEGMVYRFYWDEWADNVPICQDVNDIFTLCSTFLNISGVNIGRDPSLLSKLATIGTKSLSEDHGEANLARWQDLLKRLIVPALSLTKSNTSVVNEVYDMLRYYPCQTRFSIYAEWYEGATSRVPAVVSAFSRARLETISTMKRISMTNLTPMARSLAKVAYANPGIVFKVALDQIEAYSNLTEVVVECAKYFTDLGYDVLMWSLMSSLGGKARSRVRNDSALLRSRWLIALSKFSGKIFKRYSIMNPEPILQYVKDQLFQGHSTDVIILEELITQMSGVVSDVDFTDSQLQAMSGGEILRRQTLINLQDKRFESSKTAKRLLRSLTETKLAGQILIALAQNRQASIYAVPEEDAHIKYLATMVDEAQRILVQYLDLLRSNLSVEQFDALVPNTAELITEYGLEPSLAFLIGRSSYARRMSILQVSSPKDPVEDQYVTNGTSLQVDGDGDVSMKIEDSIAVTILHGEGSDAEDAPQAVVQFDGAGAPLPRHESWLDELAPLIDAVKTVLPENSWRLLTPDFYVMFWQLSLADIHMPIESYRLETTRLTKEISEILKDRTDMTRLGMARKEEARKALEATKNAIMDELKEDVNKYERIKGGLNKERLLWFNNVNGKYDKLVIVLLEECFLPRVLLSPSDADYSFKFIKFLHSNGTPNFRTLGIYAQLFRPNRLRTLIFACTIREAEHLGRFLKHVLADLSKWHASKTTYEKEALGTNRDLPGFATKMGEDDKPATLLEHEHFRRFVFTIHKNLNTALKSCLKGMEWMHIRNAITVLKAVVEYFPALDFMGAAYQATLLDISTREKPSREDLSLLANALMPELKKRQAKWVMPQAFVTNVGEVTLQPNGVKGKDALSNSSQSDSTASKSILQPTAPEFKPTSTSNGTPNPKPITGSEVEDGEVDDAKAGEKTGGVKQIASLSTISGPLAGSVSVTTQNTSQEHATESVVRDDPKVPISTISQSGPPRPDFGKGPLTTSLLDKPHLGLPSRPDVPFPSPMPSDRHMSQRRDNIHNRPDRSGEGLRDRRDPAGFDRRAPDSLSRDLNRLAERDIDRDRHESKRRDIGTGRDLRDNRDMRSHHDRSLMDATRLPDMSGRLSRNEDMPPPRSNATEALQGATANTDPLLNPARAANIFGGNELPRSELSRTGRDDHRDRPSSRPHSPRRGDRYGTLDRDHPDPRRNDRPPPGRGAPPYIPDYSRGRNEDMQSNTMRARGDQSADRGPSERPRDAFSFQPTPPSTRQVDPDHGRLNQSLRSQDDPNFGRLNGGPVGQIPSGPSRDRNNRINPGSNRIASAQQPRFDTRPIHQEPARPPTPDKQPPTGPAAGRASRRTGSGMFETPSSAPLSTPSTPASTSPQVPVHPDRLRRIDPGVSQQASSGAAAQTFQPSPPSNATIPSGIHPSRLQAFQSDQLPPRHTLPAIQTSVNNSVASAPISPMTAGPPSGPKILQPSSTAVISPNGIPPPTGPSSTNDRSRGPNRQLAGINNTLQQAGQRMGPDRLAERGTSIRGRGGRIGFSAHGSDLPSSPASSILNNLPLPRDGPGQGSMERNRDVVNPDRPADLFQSRVASGTDNEREHDRSDSRSGAGSHGREPVPPHARRESGRSGRHSHRSSRSRSPGREGERERDRERGRDRGAGGISMEEPPRGEYRDRGRLGGDGGRDGRRNDRDMGRRDGGDKPRDIRDGMPPRTVNDPEWGAIQGPQSDRGSGIMGDRGGRRDMRSGGDNRRDIRGDGSGRKRRGEEGGMSSDIRGHDKRPRREGGYK